MHQFEIYSVINTCISIAFLVWFFVNPYQKLLIDKGRQKIFFIRDEIFNVALKNKVDFKSKEYQEIREALNASLEYFDKFTLESFIIISKFDREKPKMTLIEKINAIPNATLRIELIKLIIQVYETVYITACLRSPFTWLFLLISLKEKAEKQNYSLIENDIKTIEKFEKLTVQQA